MHEDLIRGYKNFLASSITFYLFGKSIIQKEIEHFTNGELQDELIFFVCTFGKFDSKALKNIDLKNPATFAEYVTLKDKIVLTEKGKNLKIYLEKKLEAHAAILEFNGIKPRYIGQITTIMRRFEKFWKIMLDFSKKNNETDQL